MSETAAALGIGPSFEFEGKSYRVPPRDLDMEALFEVYVRENCHNAIRRMQQQGALQPQEYVMHMDGWRQDVAAFAYSFGENICWRALLSAPGSKYMAMLHLGRGGDSGVTMELVERIHKDADAWKRLTDAIHEANNPPNSQAPTKGQPASA